MARINRISKRRAAARRRLSLFDAVIDCLYEYDLGQELPQRWPVRVRVAIEAARKRILKRRFIVKSRAMHRARRVPWPT